MTVCQVNIQFISHVLILRLLSAFQVGFPQYLSCTHNLHSRKYTDWFASGVQKFHKQDCIKRPITTPEITGNSLPVMRRNSK